MTLIVIGMKIRLIFLLALTAVNAQSQFIPFPSAPADLASQPSLWWKYKANGPFVGTPVIRDGIAYIGSLDSTLYALDLSQKKLKWKLSTGGAIRSSACIDGNTLYLLSSDGLLYRVGIDSGMLEGTFRTMNGYMGDRQRDFADYFNSTPVMVDSTLYFGSGESVYALKVNDGNIKWVYKTGDVVHSRPVIHMGRLYIGSFDGHLYCIDIATGNLVWKFKTTGISAFPKGEVMGNPVVAGEMVYAGARDFNLYAIDAYGGYANWMKSFSSGWAMAVTSMDSVIIVAAADERAIYAYNAHSGQQLWRTPSGFNVIGECAIGSTLGYFGTLAGKVSAFDLSTGQIVWTVGLDSYKDNHLSWFNEEDAYREDINRLLKTPVDLLKMYGQLGSIFGAPALSSDMMVVAGYDGWVYVYSSSGN